MKNNDPLIPEGESRPNVRDLLKSMEVLTTAIKNLIVSNHEKIGLISNEQGNAFLNSVQKINEWTLENIKIPSDSLLLAPDELIQIAINLRDSAHALVGSLGSSSKK